MENRTVSPWNVSMRPQKDRSIPLIWHQCAVIAGWCAVCSFVYILWKYAPEEHSFYPRCGFLEMTGWQCAGCGMLRATHALVHGEWLEALRYNVLWVAALPVILGVWIWHSVAVFRGKPRQVWNSLKKHPCYCIAAALIALVYMILRNVMAGF